MGDRDRGARVRTCSRRKQGDGVQVCVCVCSSTAAWKMPLASTTYRRSGSPDAPQKDRPAPVKPSKLLVFGSKERETEGGGSGGGGGGGGRRNRGARGCLAHKHCTAPGSPPPPPHAPALRTPSQAHPAHMFTLKVTSESSVCMSSSRSLSTRYCTRKQWWWSTLRPPAWGNSSAATCTPHHTTRHHVVPGARAAPPPPFQMEEPGGCSPRDTKHPHGV
jgi:hypothetical protein